MKKILLLVLSMAMLVCAVPHMAFAVDVTTNVNGLIYTLDDLNRTATLTNGSGAMGEVAIPDAVYYGGNNYNVTTIGEVAFESNGGLTSVTIPDSVTSIDGYAFDQCFGLTSVTIGSNVALIGEHAFAACIGLRSVEIPDRVTSIGEEAFEYCHNLESVTIGSSVNTIGRLAFGNCESLESIMIPRSVNTIGYQAFDECDSLTSINVTPENPYFESSEDGVLFSRGGEELLMFPCGKTGNYNIPDTVEIIDDYAFTSSSLESVTIGSGVTTIRDSAFWYCQSLQSVGFNNNVLTKIGDSAFQRCSELSSVVLPDSVKTIGSSAFEECDALSSVKIGSRIETIGSSAFAGCDDLTSITIPRNFDKSKFIGTDIRVVNNNCFYNDGNVQGTFELV